MPAVNQFRNSAAPYYPRPKPALNLNIEEQEAQISSI